jgi:hypothetical protein
VAVRRVDMNQELLAAGRAAVRDVRESQDALISAQNQLTESVVLYLQVRLGLLLDIGILAGTDEKFWLKDPLAGLPASKVERSAPSPAVVDDRLVPPNQVLEPLQ